MKWSDITVQQFQQIYKLSQREPSRYDIIEEVDNSCEVISIIYGYSQRMIEGMTLKRFNKLRGSIAFLLQMGDIPGSAPRTIGKGFRRYKINYDIKDLSLGQYIDLNSFAQDLVPNIPLILGTILRKDKKDPVSELNRIAEDMERVPITEAYHAVKVILRNFQQLNRSYSGLFESTGEEDDQTGSSDFRDKFNQRYGWIYSATQVAEFEKITLEEAYNMNIVRALNDLSYLKAKAQYDKQEVKSWRKV